MKCSEKAIIPLKARANNTRPGGHEGRKENTMNYKITITEMHKAVVDIEANSHDEALRRVEEEYWNNPNDYVLEPKDTFFE